MREKIKIDRSNSKGQVETVVRLRNIFESFNPSIAKKVVNIKSTRI